MKEKKIFVFAGFQPEDMLIGTIHVAHSRGKEIYSFEYDEEWLKNSNMIIDPDLQFYRGRQYLNSNKNIFGVFADSCPDRWGRILMNRREALRARSAGEKPAKLMESDYLLGVYDESRMGGLRFKLDINGEFVSNDKEFATPPWTSLRGLEQASAALEKGDSDDARWLRQLIAPGSSLGGARPKASVIAPDGTLWIAKFPSKNDSVDSGAWEKVVHDLAEMCGINVPEAKAERFSESGTTFLTKRFDRQKEKRIHYSSAMTMLGKADGAGAADGSGYLDMVSFIKANGASPAKDLRELWKRIVFSMAVSNTDDHFRNHGFILTEKGWILSPMFDVNPDIFGEFLSLNVDNSDCRMDFNLAQETAQYYGIDGKEAKAAITEIISVVKNNWESKAKAQGIKRDEIKRMEPAFSLCT